MDENDKRFIETLFTRQTEQFQQYLGVIADNFDHKLDVVAEGQQMLAERMDRMEERLDSRIDQVEKRLGAIAADLSAHRADTEAHHGVYRVKEE